MSVSVHATNARDKCYRFEHSKHRVRERLKRQELVRTDRTVCLMEWSDRTVTQTQNWTEASEAGGRRSLRIHLFGNTDF